MLTPLNISAMFSTSECDEIIRLAMAEGPREAGLVRGRQNESIRTARISWLDETGDAAWVFDRVMATVASANREHFGFDLTEFAERSQVAIYEANNDSHFDWHSDIGAGTFAEKRKLTLVAQLSDAADYQGGLLELNGTGQVETAATERGGATLFPSFIPHRVTKVTEGIRYSLTTWVHGPAFR
ncbi:2OG-Fe(II) oxygenase [Marivivens donghaensis]|uniref:2OG-Fe(II) oxygenase n=1 Tax=Marivivens donghaensis TaxID=1699413 RepID=A0ABX0W0T4_9RHOB|nr:2OG-Fe(II) oxygenase [Marivivens donghaensis]NIY73940.1 2OG-Fe(II) oxygenase [Marivivens donghaensis]